jgi:hypothetical protein
MAGRVIRIELEPAAKFNFRPGQIQVAKPDSLRMRNPRLR